MKGLGFRRIVSAAIAAAVLVVSLPATARANCATDYVVCLTDLGGHATSDSLHELECWGDYIDCIAALILRV